MLSIYGVPCGTTLRYNVLGGWMMAKFAARLRALRNSKGLTQENLAEQIGVKRSTIAGYEAPSKEREPDYRVASKLAAFFNVSMNYLLGYSDFPNPEVSGFVHVGKTRLIPILKTLSPGVPDRAESNTEGWEEVLEEDMEGGKDYFFWRVRDDAMEPLLRVGYLVLVREQPEVEDGEVAAVVVNGRASVRRVYTSGDVTVLKSDNPASPPVISSRREVQIVGKVVEARFKL
jgi:repressor LexA